MIGPDRDEAGREVLDALAGSTTTPDPEILAAVQEGLMAVPAGSPSAWFEVPRQRTRTRPANLTTRRTAEP
ncbi:hypothetical protein [Cellulomonas sp. NS3]|uniref:hypothetical protein n=1 Tax=Cellulomonas sp. NS3 TaxID=2973977 RepID=UPI0021615782|nr:hypothetical protein [Cellulomonas sp. NS3]